MLPYPEIDPVAVAIGPLKIRWYGLMYLIGFAIAWFLARSRAKRPEFGWKIEWVDDLIFYAALGLILGARIGYMLFYGADTWTRDPVAILKVWEGGMSFHGGLLGLALCVWLYGRKIGKGFFEVTDFVAPLAPLGLFCGRLGNFINGELWGKPTDVPWAFVVDGVPRRGHASIPYGNLAIELMGQKSRWSQVAREMATLVADHGFATVECFVYPEEESFADRATLLKLLAQLTGTGREELVLHHLLGLSFEEVGAVTGVTSISSVPAPPRTQTPAKTDSCAATPCCRAGAAPSSCRSTAWSAAVGPAARARKDRTRTFSPPWTPDAFTGTCGPPATQPVSGEVFGPTRGFSRGASGGP